MLASVIEPNFWWLLGIMLLFSWMGFVGVVRAEFLRARNFDYVRAARALGASNPVIMYRHVLPNAMVATITFLPFILTGGITSACRPAPPRSASCWPRARPTCRRPGSASPGSSPWRSC